MNKQTAAKTVLTTWLKSTYDVWGNKADGYEVNDRFGCGEIEIRCKITHHNVGTAQEFASVSPSDYQLKQVFGVHCAITTEGDDVSIYVNRAADGYPIGELHCSSHDSLSPVRLKPQTFLYFINLDERGQFSADVRNSAGETVYDIKAGSELAEGETSIFDDGFMKHRDDLDGLTQYLRSLGIIGARDTITNGN